MSLSFWFYWQGIPTPDQSLIPQIPASVGFGTAFVIRLARASLARCAVVDRPAAGSCTSCWRVIATGWMLHTMHASPMAQPGLTKTLFAMMFGVAVWGWVLGLTGAALRFLSNYSATRRYIADASYWIYLVHLPVVAAFQVWVGPLAAALEREVSLHPRRELRDPVRELSLPGAPDLHRAAAERPQISAQAISAGGHALALSAATRGHRQRAARSPSCAASPRSSAP